MLLDYGLLQKKYEGVHLWLVRRWNAVSIAATSVVGLLLSLPLGVYNPVIPIPCNLWWTAPVIVLVCMLATVGVFAWLDNMRMFGFLIQITGDGRKQQIRQRAYELWQHADRPEGQAKKHWLQAEAEITAEWSLCSATESRNRSDA